MSIATGNYNMSTADNHKKVFEELYIDRWTTLGRKMSKLNPRRFDFNVFGRGGRKPSKWLCWTSGCVVGWLPSFFSEDWCWKKSDGPALKGLKYESATSNFAMFFGVNTSTSRALVLPVACEIPIDVTPDLWIEKAVSILARDGFHAYSKALLKGARSGKGQ